jgi:uncharacterized caspase-like protein
MRLNRFFAIFVSCLLPFGVLSVIPSTAVAQQQEKRIALVIGNGAYTKVPLATAANDGGLIAQTLQAAGFDVSGARDLDGDTLRGAFRDFMKKAEASGPDTVAVVYLAGYGLQLAGENYFIPVDSTIAHDTDIPVEGLRISDYMRQLAALPLKLSVVVLDIAREQPFIEGGSIASGLALVEPNPRMLIAFNAAPGTVAPEEQGPYGAYAQALAEMIRTGGLPLPELFNRVRLRVNENTKGAQVPWDTQKVDDAQFMFFDRAPDAPAAAPPDQVAAVRDKPIRDLGASDAYVAALDRDTLQGYEDFLGAYPRDAMAKRVRAIVAARREAITWRRSYRADTADAYWSYLRRYPRGPHAADARRRLAILSAALEPPPTFAMIDYDVPPPPPDEIVYIDRPVLMFSDPDFDFAPPPPPPVFFLPPPPPDFIVLEPPPPPVGLFYLPSPLFVPIPAYVIAPAYVRPPPNNIIFTNIHNTTVINNVINRPSPVANPAAPLVNPAAPHAGPGARTGPVQNPTARAQVGQPAMHAGPALPAAVMRKATLIQQGKAPVPPSASIHPAATAGSVKRSTDRLPGPRHATPAAAGTQVHPGTPQPATTSPTTAPGAGNPPTPGQSGKPVSGSAPTDKQQLPKTNALPVPGTKGVPPAPAASTSRPGTITQETGPASGARRPGGGVSGPAASPGMPKPGAATPRGPQTEPQIRRQGSPSRTAPTAVAPPHAPPRAAPARSAPPRPHAAPPPRMAAPPRPAPHAAPPPRRMAAPPRPAPHVAPPPRMAPPRAAPPPRPVAPPRAAPPPRPAAHPAPPPRAAPAAKKCPPNVTKC